MLLVPVGAGKPRENLFSTGIGVIRDETDRTLVSGVWSGSPADRLGIAPGDEMVAVDGLAAASYHLSGLWELLKNNNTAETVTLLIRNDAMEKAFKVRKEYLFPLNS